MSFKILFSRNYFRYLLSLNKQRKFNPLYIKLSTEHLQDNPWNHIYAKLTVSCSESLVVMMLWELFHFGVKYFSDDFTAAL